jgi:hypothetical protein
VKSPRNEQGIVTETCGSFLTVENSSFNGAGEGRHDLSLASQRDDASKARSALFFRNTLEVCQKQFVIFRIGGAPSRITGRVDSGSAAKGIDLQTGVISDDPSIVNLCHGDRLERGIFLKGLAGLLDAWSRDGKRREVRHAKRRAKNDADFAHLVRVVGGSQQRNNRSRHSFCVARVPVEGKTFLCRLQMGPYVHRVLERGIGFANLGLDWLRAWFWFVLSIALGLLIQENFPFSNWPMYADFTPESGYVYVVNGRNEPVAIISFSETAARLRKQFERERKAARKRAHLARKPITAEEVDEEAGARLLQRLARRLSSEERASIESLGLVSARVKMNEERVVKTSERLVARIRMADLPAYVPQSGDVPAAGSQISR